MAGGNSIFGVEGQIGRIAVMSRFLQKGSIGGFAKSSIHHICRAPVAVGSHVNFQIWSIVVAVALGGRSQIKGGGGCKRVVRTRAGASRSGVCAYAVTPSRVGGSSDSNPRSPHPVQAASAAAPGLGSASRGASPQPSHPRAGSEGRPLQKLRLLRLFRLGFRRPAAGCPWPSPSLVPLSP